MEHQHEMGYATHSPHLPLKLVTFLKSAAELKSVVSIKKNVQFYNGKTPTKMTYDKNTVASYVYLNYNFKKLKLV